MESRGCLLAYKNKVLNKEALYSATHVKKIYDLVDLAKSSMNFPQFPTMQI